MHKIPLSPEEDAFMASLIKEAHNSHFQQIAETVNGRLMQARHSIKELTHALRIALLNGEAEDSLYIRELTNKITVLIAQQEELNALCGAERKMVA